MTKQRFKKFRISSRKGDSNGDIVTSVGHMGCSNKGKDSNCSNDKKDADSIEEISKKENKKETMAEIDEDEPFKAKDVIDVIRCVQSRNTR